MITFVLTKPKIMKNADQPINPCLMQQVGGNEFRANKPNDPKEWNVPTAGLTKREYFAGLAMQGLLTTVEPASSETILQIPSNIAKWSVKCADELLKEFETTQAD